jgi:hypothetical protein
MTQYSGPEMATEWRICRRLLAEVLRNPCAHCKFRVEGWGAVACSSTGLTFPMCTKRGSPSFELDESTIKGAA